MKKDGLADSTIRVTDSRSRMMAKCVDIDNPEKIIEYLAKKEGKNDKT